MKKKRLEIEFHYDFELLGVISTARGYKLAWELNQLLNIRLIKQKDLVLYRNNKVESEHTHYLYQTKVSSIRLLRNKSIEALPLHYLVPEHTHLDFIVRITGGLSHQELLELMRNIPSVELITYIPLAALKSKDNFIF